MESDKPRRRTADPAVPAEMADEPREVVREAADEPRRGFHDPQLIVAPDDEPYLVPREPDLPQPLLEQADEPRTRPSG